jgi:peptide methionine sulfoxide reductase msrA/msrB
MSGHFTNIMKKVIIFLIIVLFTIIGCSNYEGENTMKELNKNNLETAYFAGGCFWCMEAAFEAQDGVDEVISGFSGGSEVDPTYDDVVRGKTGHKEAIKVYYDSKVVSYSELVELFWKQIDPTDDDGQFSDRGASYRTAIFYKDSEEKTIAESSKNELENSGKFDKPIVTEILEFKKFYEAEEYHQNYYKKKTVQYKLYEEGSGRAGFKREMWNEGE